MKKILYGILILLILGLAVFFFVVPTYLDKSANKTMAHTPVVVSEQARELHEKLFIADLHCDALLWSRNLLERHDYGHVDVPRLLEGNVALEMFTVVSKVPFGLNFESNDAGSDQITLLAIAERWPVPTWFSLRERALYQAHRLHRFAEQSAGKLVIIKSKSDLETYLQRRESGERLTAGLLGIEGAQVLEGNPANVMPLFDAGFRMMGLTHFFDNEVAGSAHGVQKGGLTEMGKQTISLMEQAGMLVDLAHASPQTIDDVLDMAKKPVLVSHTGVKGTCDKTRNLSDAHVRRIAATGGVIGIAYFEEAVCGTEVNAVVEAIRHVVDLVGVDHVALGSDFDGAVTTIFDSTGLIELTQALLDAGFAGRDIAKIMGGNVQRLLLQTLPN